MTRLQTNTRPEYDTLKELLLEMASAPSSIAAGESQEAAVRPIFSASVDQPSAHGCALWGSRVPAIEQTGQITPVVGLHIPPGV